MANATLHLEEGPHLLPCPFCGSNSIDHEGWTSLEQYKGTDQYRSGPACDTCGASAQSVKEWNTRAPPAVSRAEQQTGDQQS